MTFTDSDRKIFITSFLLLLLFSYLLYDDSIFTTFSQENRESIGQILQQSRDVRRKSSSEFSWLSTTDHQKVFNNDSIFTGNNSTAIISLNDGSQIEIQEKSLVQLKQGKDKDFELNLIEGLFTAQLSKNQTLTLNLNGEKINLKADSKSELKIERKKDGKIKIETSTGQVVSQNKQGKFEKIQKIWEKKSTTPEVFLADKKVLTPLVQPQFLDKKNQHIFVHEVRDLKTEVLQSLQLNWTDHPAYQTFDLEISKGPNSNLLMERYTVANTNHEIKELSEGTYTARVRAKTKTQVSEWSAPYTFRLIIQKELYIPLEIPTLARKVFYYDAQNSARGPVVSWIDKNTNALYELHISSNAAFSDSLIIETTEKFFEWRKYLSGIRYLRVRAIDKKSKTGWSETSRLEVTIPKLALKDIQPIKAQARNLASAPQQMVPLEWNKVPRGKTYVVQVSPTADFKNAQELKTASNKMQITIDQPGELFTRVLAFDDEGKNLQVTSEPQTIRYTLSMPLEDPRILFPKEDQHLFVQDHRKPLFNLEWSPVRGAEMYEIQFAQDPDFQTVVRRIQTRKTRHILRNELPLGRVHWRVKAYAKATRQPSNFVQYQENSNWSDNETFKFGFGESDIFEK